MVDNPVALLEGLDRANFDTAMITTLDDHAEDDCPLAECGSIDLASHIHKRHLLGKVTAIHYIYSAADVDPYAGYGRLNDWSECDPSQAYDTIARECHLERYTREVALLNGRSTPSLFSRLSRRSHCAWTQFNWHTGLDAETPFYNSFAEPQPETAFEYHLSQRAPITPAPNICGLWVDGPLGYPAMAKLSTFETTDTRQVVGFNVIHGVPLSRWCTVSDIFDRWDAQHWLIPGIPNALEFDHDYILGDRHVEDDIWLFLYHLDNITVKWRTCFDRQLIDETRIDFLLSRSSFGVPLGIPLGSAADHDISLMETIQRGLHNTRQNETGESKEWADRINFIWADTASPCPACGKVYKRPEGRKDQTH